MFEELNVYQQLHGHCNVSLQENASLYEWRKIQKHRLQEGHTMADYRQARRQARRQALNTLGFTWSVPAPGVYSKGAVGPDGEFVEFSSFDGMSEPRECKKDFTLFCIASRNEVKKSLDPGSRSVRDKVRALLRGIWSDMETKTEKYGRHGNVGITFDMNETR